MSRVYQFAPKEYGISSELLTFRGQDTTSFTYNGFPVLTTESVSVDGALIDLPAASSSTSAATVLGLGAFNISPIGDEISLGGNDTIRITKPGIYYFQIGLGMVAINAGADNANLYIQMLTGSANNSLSAFTSQQQVAGKPIAGVENPLYFEFQYVKQTAEGTPLFVQFKTKGNSVPTAGTAPSWNVAPASQIRIAFQGGVPTDA